MRTEGRWLYSKRNMWRLQGLPRTSAHAPVEPACPLPSSCSCLFDRNEIVANVLSAVCGAPPSGVAEGNEEDGG